ncbi:unnamed protein product [Timema podura]|uniref:G-protein coupled receptors family 1 profile domain-containing protein n=1 Tax=Timema podura TaxID=61482 RepID=A0ABN7NZQ4_TIMPD|nr:unnamed protein product [Timema podura]
MLVLVVVLFVICWGPMLIDNLLTAYDVLPKLLNRTPSQTHGHRIPSHGLFQQNFRESFYKALCICCYKGRQLNRNASVSQTRTTSVRAGSSTETLQCRKQELHLYVLDAASPCLQRTTDGGAVGGAVRNNADSDKMEMRTNNMLLFHC